jgi:MYXO-CTERM domain-containing protein
LPHWLELHPGVETEVLQEIVEEDQPYAPCFALNVWDPAGHAIQARPVCGPAVKPSERLHALDPATRGGCSVTGRSVTGAWWAIGALVAAAVTVRRRTR